jgi:type II secretory pathway pseudopilin PulG
MRHRRHGMTLIDLLVAICLLGLLSAICMAQAILMDTIENRVKCASNLRQIGQAILMYSNDNKGAYPRTMLSGDNDPIPVWGTPYEGNKDIGACTSDKPDETADPFIKDDKPAAKFKPKPNDVTAALFLLLRTQDITPEVFVCPATMQEKWEFGGGANTALNWTNWQGNDVLRKHLSYSYQNPYASPKAIASGFRLNNSITAEFAIVADMNPGTDALLKLNLRSTPSELRAGNTANHSREGQNVMYGDGHVSFEQSPFVGVKRDNIYTYGVSGGDKPESGGDGFAGSPVSPDDSILLPTARSIGLADENGDLLSTMKVQPLSAEQKTALRKDLSGKYTRYFGQQQFELTITDDQLIAVGGPVTINYHYEVVERVGDRVRLKLTASKAKDAAMYIALEPPGLVIKGNPYLVGGWHKQ